MLNVTEKGEGEEGDEHDFWLPQSNIRRLTRAKLELLAPVRPSPTRVACRRPQTCAPQPDNGEYTAVVSLRVCCLLYVVPMTGGPKDCNGEYGGCRACTRDHRLHLGECQYTHQANERRCFATWGSARVLANAHVVDTVWL